MSGRVFIFLRVISVIGNGNREAGFQPFDFLVETLFRSGIGPGAKLYACELDKYTMDLLAYTGRGTDADIRQCFKADCALGEDTVDIINMTGVHLGNYLDESGNQTIEKVLLPWLRTMAKALRPGGVLVINDGTWDMIENGMQIDRQEKTYYAGDTVRVNGTLDYIEAGDRSTFTFLFEVKKKR